MPYTYTFVVPQRNDAHHIAPAPDDPTEILEALMVSSTRKVSPEEQAQIDAFLDDPQGPRSPRRVTLASLVAKAEATKEAREEHD